MTQQPCIKERLKNLGGNAPCVAPFKGALVNGARASEWVFLRAIHCAAPRAGQLAWSRKALRLGLMLGALALSGGAVQAQPETLLGQYACSFTQGDYSYKPFKCQITQVGNALQLEKTSGSQRIKGSIVQTAEGFDFSGVFFCPWGDCTSAAKGSFQRLGPGRYRGVISTESGLEPTQVDLSQKP